MNQGVQGRRLAHQAEIAVLVVLSLFVAACWSAISPDQAFAASVTNGNYIIQSKLGSKVLDVAGGSASDGANIEVYFPNDTAAQITTITKNSSNGAYRITFKASGKALDTEGNVAGHANAQQWSANSCSGQGWLFEDAGDGYVYIKNKYGYYLDVMDGWCVDGQTVQLWDGNRSDAQKWKLIPVSGQVATSVDGAVYTISSKLSSNKVMEMAGAGTGNLTNVDIKTKASSSSYSFAIGWNPLSYGFYIRDAKSNRFLDSDGNGSRTANVQIFDGNSGDGQSWFFEDAGNGYVYIRNKWGYYLDVQNGSSADGSSVQVWTFNGSDAQKWKLTRTGNLRQSDIQWEYNCASTAVSNTTSEKNTATSNLNNKRQSYDKGSIGFFESVGAWEAINIINNAPYRGYTHVGNVDDATSLVNMKDSLYGLELSNRCRGYEGRSQLMVSDELMALAQSNANASYVLRTHSRQYFDGMPGTRGENLWFASYISVDDAFFADTYSWYTWEKNNYVTRNGQQTGHYEQFLNTAYQVMGYGMCTAGGCCESNVFGSYDYYPGTCFTVNDYKNRFMNYYNAVVPAYNSAASVSGIANAKYDTAVSDKSRLSSLLSHYKSGHTYTYKTTAATCTTAGSKVGTCSVCGSTTTTTLPAKGHTEVKVKAVAATCEFAGKTEGTRCSTCKATIEKQLTIPAKGHDYKETVVKATCETNGYTSHVCTRCNKSYRDNQVSAKGHTVVYDRAVAATCATAGKTKGEHCSTCNQVFIAQETVPALGHTYNPCVVEPTCEKGGYTINTCSKCGNVYNNAETKALGHQWGDWTTVSEPTQPQTGLKKRVCAHDSRHVEWQEIPALKGEGDNSGSDEKKESPTENDAPADNDVPSGNDEKPSNNDTPSNGGNKPSGQGETSDNQGASSGNGSSNNAATNSESASSSRTGNDNAQSSGGATQQSGGNTSSGSQNGGERIASVASGKPVEDFASRLYTDILDRQPDEAGKSCQVNALNSGTAPAEIAFNYFDSAEYKTKGESHEKTVERVYQVMFGRDADAAGKAMWVGYLDSGMSVRAVIAGFSQSDEYKAYFAKLGVDNSTIGVTEARDKNPGVTGFCGRLYTECLGRSFDVEGLNAQANAILNGMSASQIAVNYFTGGEFAGQGLSNDRVVERCYKTMMGRASDTDGKAFWLGKMNAGMSVEDLVKGFAQSSEWAEICTQYGVAK